MPIAFLASRHTRLHKLSNMRFNIASNGAGAPAQWRFKQKDGSLSGTAASKNGSRFQIPAWVEADNLEFGKQTAAGIILVESWPVFDRLCRARAWRTLNMVIVCGHGIPRAGVRRFIHRLAEESTLPVYLLADNDTWGYFIFSLLKRGLLAPHMVCPWISIGDLRFLGICSGDAEAAVRRGLQLREWQSGWDARMQRLDRYDCFRTAEWHDEFKAFRRQGGGINLLGFYTAIGSKEFVNGYLCDRIRERNWLK